jgi:GNAT superfamily N-acetyltransferase
MQDLLARGLRDVPEIAFLHPGDLAWSIGWPPQSPDELAAKVTIVEDGDRVVGWGYLDREDILEAVDPDASDPDAVWHELDAIADAHPALARSTCEGDAAAVERLRAAGFAPMPDEYMIGFSIDLDAIDDIAPDDRVRPVDPERDLSERASVTRAGFRVDTPLDRYVERYERFTRSPAYPRGWDLVASTEDGRGAACTIAWPDPVSRVGNFEPVATHPDFQRQGYASAAMRDGLRRLRDAGMRRAIVRTRFDNDAGVALYRSLGFVDHHIERWFSRS